MLATVSKFGLFLIRFLIFLSTRENIPTIDLRKSTRNPRKFTCDLRQFTRHREDRLFTPTGDILSVG